MKLTKEWSDEKAEYVYILEPKRIDHKDGTWTWDRPPIFGDKAWAERV